VASASSRRYARAIFELAQESDKGGDQVEAWAKRLAAVRAVLTDERVRRVLVNPTIPTATRVELVAGLADRGMGKEGLNLAKLLVASRRVGVIDGIVEEYERLADETAGRVRATATTAVELSDGDRRRVGKELSERLGKEVRLEVRVDPAILGGLVLQFGDRVIDASVAARLQRLRRRLLTA
jgi:F-type H+-transporting ATPase subunit delta